MSNQRRVDVQKTFFTKVGNIKPSEPVEQKLSITDYVFCYNNEDLDAPVVKYWFDKMQCIKYEDGKKQEETFSPITNVSISALGKSKKECSLSFVIEMDLETLNKLPEKVININKDLVSGESLFYDYDGKTEVIDFDLEKEIYCFVPSCFVRKIEHNKFVFKIQTQNLFTWFYVDFGAGNN